MCSVNDAGDIEDLSNHVPISKLKIKILPDKCNKCKESKPHILLRNKDAYCKDCFISSTIHKFRALLGKHRLIKDGDKVLIYYKGGHPTTSLLNFLKIGSELDTPKRIKFVPICLFVENQFNSLSDNRLIVLNNIRRELKRFNIPLYFSSLLEFYKSNGHNLTITPNIENIFADTTSKNKEEDVFETTETLANDLKKIYERRLLLSAARKLDCKFIFTPELSTNIASQILSDVALGRGSHIPSNTGFCDTRDEDITIIRPLRVFDIKELALYNYFHNLDPVILPVEPVKSSIQDLIENFVGDLQCSYPATVTTILKTGDKLSMANTKKKSSEICYICKGPIEVPFQAITSHKAVQFSSEISKPKQHTSTACDKVEKENTVCYSCSKIEEFLL